MCPLPSLPYCPPTSTSTRREFSRPYSPRCDAAPSNYIISSAVAGVYNNVRHPSESANFSFSFVLHHLPVSGKLLKSFHPSLLVSGFENIERGGEVYVENTRPESAPDAVNLVWNADSVHYYCYILLLLLGQMNQRIAHPAAFGPAI